MIQCADCHVSSWPDLADFARDAGDWVWCCPECGVKNILAATLIGKVPVPYPPFEVLGWRE